MISCKVYFCDGCYGVIIFPEFSVDSIYFEVGNFNYVHFLKPIKQSLVPYIIFDLPEDHNNYSCLEVIFESRPNIHFASPSDIQEWVLFRCNLCSTIESSLHTLEHQLSGHIKYLSVIKTKGYLYFQGDMSGLIGIRDLYYLRKWISTLGLKIDTEILWSNKIKNLVGYETIN